ncbi:bifunctional diguanylate cyclase/phosphodiesterase [Dactylosporangium vinaceum]|uniref:Bifunctional diguanylate cyclase/phosphodiesterase n=1 Tax=Dactylosporangium vinaceum TaxID=53362 RepID=A0ABV5MD13_9ACTN|nr:bifunctional diguanylate cyclase/phosphodiesterase [Dactylosporangium vinaceum]UAC00802.1 bifunctional diguanylate cyclase/phosphodiesterase [Dactylosporangium vinaceum]
MTAEVRPSGAADFTRAWTRAVTDHTVLRLSRDEISTLLAGFVSRLSAALHAEPFVADAGRAIGADLVGSGIATPELLGATTTLIGKYLLSKPHLDELLGAFVAGYTGALVDQTVAAQEALRRAELADRRRDAAGGLLRNHLTRLPNRRALLQRLGAVLDDRVAPARLGLCLINLDRFRTVNDSLGYRSGDQVLLTVAHRLERLAGRGGHFPAHLGIDTFVLLIEDTTGPDEVTKAAEQALAAIAQTFPINNGYTLPIGASIGVVERATTGADPAALLGAAEQALAWAKRESRGHWTVFDPDRAAAENARHALSAQLPDALTRDEFVVHFQPLTDLATGRSIGAEALVRWQHPQLGLVMPGRFIDLAEHTGLIVPLGELVLRRACAEAAGRPGDLLVSVNVADAQLRRPGLPAMIRAILDETGLPAARLQLEVTENVLLDPAELGTLDEIARMGVRIALDDFGTGNCRLAEISNLPVHNLKIAACFIDFLRAGPAAAGPDRTVLTAMINLGHDLGLTVTAEGIETAVQREQLLALGCDTGQGYHLGRPAERFGE